jgi:two-component system, OmpR family, alkaline phosphatase synthesis response regulator PhoP
MTKILVIEDEADLLAGLEINLTREGYEVAKASRGDTGLAMAMSENPDLIVLDVMLPGMNGFDVCRELRQRGFERPVIMLTAKSDEIDKVLGLEIGSDDYVTKPFGLRELLARIRVRLRRQSRSTKTPAQYSFGSINVDFDQMRTTSGEKPVELTAKEYDLLGFFVRHRGEVLTRDRILNDVWGYNCHVAPRTVDAHILKLRHKLEKDPANPDYILTIYGEGYKFLG